MILDGDVFTAEERSSFEAELDKYVKRNKDNRQEINRLVFEAIATMTEADEAKVELENKSFLQRLVGGFTGSNKELQDKINKNHAAAQYAAQQTLNKLAEQNMMSYELIVAVNNKLNASMNDVNAELKNIYSGLAKFLRRSVNALVMIEERLDKIEHNVELGRWKDMIAFKELGDTEYQDLSPAGKIVCIAREFYEKTNGVWSTEDLLYIRSVMAEINIHQKDKVNYYQVLQEINTNKAIKNKLLGDVKTLQNVNPEYMISMGVLNKLDSLSSKEKYIVETMRTYLQGKGVNATVQEVCDDLTQKYIQDIAGVNLNVDVDAYDMILDLLYNIKGLEDIEGAKIIPDETSVAMIMENDETDDSILLKLDCNKELANYKCSGKEKAEEVMEDNLEEQDRENKGIELWEQAHEFEEIDTEKYLQLLKESAALGNVDAMFDIGYYYDDAENNKDIAKSWYENAAKNGFVPAFIMLGLICYEEEDYQCAAKYYRKAADAGDNDGMCYLAQCYENGEGVDRDWNKAYDLYWKAAKAGHEEAKKWLDNNTDTGSMSQNDSVDIVAMAAELLGVLVHGKLKNGKQIWPVRCGDYGSRFIKYRALEGKDTESSDWWLKGNWMIDQMEKNNESMIGFAFEANFIDAWEYIVFTEDAVYFQGPQGTQERVPYGAIVDVKVDSSSIYYFIYANGKDDYITSQGEWDGKLGMDNLRLFFLIMARIEGNCNYQFTNYEQGKLADVRLEALGGKGILEYI